jgi:hypothetical protein
MALEEFMPPQAPPPEPEEQAMGVHYDKTRGKYTVRWTDDGRRRIKGFRTEDEAIAFDKEIQAQAGRLDAPAAEPVAREPGRGDGIYSNATVKRKRWRFVFRQSDRTISSRRGSGSSCCEPEAGARLRCPCSCLRHVSPPSWPIWGCRHSPTGSIEGLPAPQSVAARA